MSHIKTFTPMYIHIHKTLMRNHNLKGFFLNKIWQSWPFLCGKYHLYVFCNAESKRLVTLPTKKNIYIVKFLPFTQTTHISSILRIRNVVMCSCLRFRFLVLLWCTNKFYPFFVVFTEILSCRAKEKSERNMMEIFLLKTVVLHCVQLSMLLLGYFKNQNL